MAAALIPHYRTLGKTDIRVSPLGLGTVKFGRNEKVKYPTPFDLPDEDFLAGLLADASALGINLIDTAPAYGLAEERLGRLLAGQRDAWVIAGKAGEDFVDGVSTYDFNPAAIRRSVEKSLQNLQTDYLDVLLLHATTGDEDLCRDDALIRTLADLKAEKLVRAVGLSTYSASAGLLGAEIFDVLMVAYNPVWREEESTIQSAAQNGCGILLKKIFNSGHAVAEGKGDSVKVGEDTITATFRFVFRNPAVAAAIVGTINPMHLQDNVAKFIESRLELNNPPS